MSRNRKKQPEWNGQLDVHLENGVRNIAHWDRELGLLGRHPGQVVIRMGWRLEEQREEIERLKMRIADLEARLAPAQDEPAAKPTLVWLAVNDEQTCRSCGFRDGREVGEGKCDMPPNLKCSNPNGCRCTAAGSGSKEP